MFKIRAFVNPKNRFGSGWLISYGSAWVRSTAGTQCCGSRHGSGLLSHFETRVEFYFTGIDFFDYVMCSVFIYRIYLFAQKSYYKFGDEVYFDLDSQNPDSKHLGIQIHQPKNRKILSCKTVFSVEALIFLSSKNVIFLIFLRAFSSSHSEHDICKTKFFPLFLDMFSLPVTST